MANQTDLASALAAKADETDLEALETTVAGKQDTISDLSSIRADLAYDIEPTKKMNLDKNIDNDVDEMFIDEEIEIADTKKRSL